MNSETSSIDLRINQSVREFFAKKYAQKRPKLQPVRLSDPGSKAELKKIMDRVRTKNLLTFCGKIRRHKK